MRSWKTHTNRAWKIKFNGNSSGPWRHWSLRESQIEETGTSDSDSIKKIKSAWTFLSALFLGFLLQIFFSTFASWDKFPQRESIKLGGGVGRWVMLHTRYVTPSLFCHNLAIALIIKVVEHLVKALIWNDNLLLMH